MLRIAGSAKVKNFLKKRLRRIQFRDVDFVAESDNSRFASLSRDGKRLAICVPNLGALDSAESKVGLLQYFYRFAALNSLRTGYFLMHGSAAILNGMGVVFGDDGSSIGKTTSMIETALFSGDKKYIGDEFVFWDSKRNIIFSDGNILMHLRELTKQHLKNKHKIFTEEDFVLPTKFGLKRVKESPLNALAYVHFSERKNQVKILRAREAHKAAYMTLAAHFLKFFNPELDRFSFISQKDTSSTIKLGKNIRNFGKFSYIESFLKRGADVLASRTRHIYIETDSACNIPGSIMNVID